MENEIVQYVIGGAIMLVFFVLLAWAGVRRKRLGKVDKHWKDY